MKGTDFRRWAERGCRIYGQDPWAFIRELAQNSRDAGARKIEVEAFLQDGGTEVLRFTDDGCGMTLEHAREYLFRLYSSSKEQERSSAGQYGIGFWAVLRFDAVVLTIESSRSGRGWGVSADREFALKEMPCTLNAHGTRITLARRARCASQSAFVNEAEEALGRYCRHLRRNDRRASRLRVLFDGRLISRELGLPGPLSLAFKEGPVEGVVGLDHSPRVQLLARGLPVWEGLLLDELSYSGTTLKWDSEIAVGLAPVFILNGNALDVVMSRNAVIDNAALARVRKVARGALSRLVKLHMQRTFPLSFGLRITRALAGLPRKLATLPGALALLFCLAMAGVWAWPAVEERLWGEDSAGVSAVRRGGDPSPEARESRKELSEISNPGTIEEEAAGEEGSAAVDPAIGAKPGDSKHGPEIAAEVSPGSEVPLATLPALYRGSLVDAPTPAAKLQLAYEPPRDLFFRFIAAEHFEPGMGFVTRPPTDEEPEYPSFVCGDECVLVAVKLSGSGRAVLPLPSGFKLERESLQLNRLPVASVREDRYGQPVVTVPEGGGIIAYGCGPGPAARLVRSRFDALTETGGQGALAWSSEALRMMERAKGRPLDGKVAVALAWIADTMVYDTSRETAALYQGLDEHTSWLDFVLGIGKGDCDVINAAAVLFLRELGIPARLAVGVSGRNGRAVPGLHAWVEYFDDGFNAVDASAVARRERAAATGLPASESRDAEDAVRAGPAGETREWSMVESGARTAFEGDGEQGRSISTVSMPYRVLSAALVLLLAGLLAFAIRRRGREQRFTAATSPALAQKLLAQMALSAASQPDAWQHADSIWVHAILPLHTGPRISLKRAYALARCGRLFAGLDGRTELVGAAVESGAAVLDKGDRAFAPLIAQIPGVVDLDSIAALNPIPHQTDSAGAPPSLFGRINEVLAMCGAGGVECLPCPGLRGFDTIDVNLSRLALPPGFPLPARFVAVRPDSKLVGECLKVQERNPAAALFLLLESITRESHFFARSGPRVRFAAARLLMEEAA